MTKTPEQIHAEVGLPITAQHAEKMYKDGWRAYLVNDIAKIIDEAKSQAETGLRQAASDNADWFDLLVNDCAEKLGCEHKPTAVLTAIDELKAKGGACEWKYDEVHDFYDTKCGDAFCMITGTPKENHYRCCPNCGKEIKIV